MDNIYYRSFSAGYYQILANNEIYSLIINKGVFSVTKMNKASTNLGTPEYNHWLLVTEPEVIELYMGLKLVVDYG